AERVSSRISRVKLPVEQIQLDASNRLPFEDSSFDTVVTTLTLCSVGEVSAALAELHRVLRPDGRFLFLEHGLSRNAAVARWQNRLNSIQNFVACGCNLNRDVPALIANADFRIDKLDRFVLEGSPEILASMFRGIAVKD